MSAEALPQVTTTGEPAAPGAGPGGARRRLLLTAALAVALGCLFFGYLRMARVYPTNSDGAGNALQAWDILHGNPLLRGWTLSDVSFYTTELLLHAAVEMVVGLSADVVHIGAAVAYTLLVLLVALVARGRTRGRVAALRIGVALALMLAPAPGIAYLTLLSSPDHTGTGIPLLLTWLVLEYALTARDGTPREGAARWWLPVALALLLAWG
ncbi:MAG TPA: hypothetical protein VJT31_39570, partial [Rugosimonospora sp.]|nr:hypothetical protein [Rugosimonospora sp.]